MYAAPLYQYLNTQNPEFSSPAPIFFFSSRFVLLHEGGGEYLLLGAC